MQLDIDRWRQVDALFQQALALDPAERPAFLDACCAGDDDLLRRVGDLLRDLDDVGGFLDGPPGCTALLGESGWDLTPGPAAAHVGPYRLLREIGRGGMGTVYLAERTDGVFEQRAAVKRLRGDFSSGALHERFRQERQILARLEHPHITRLINGGVDEAGCPYLVMEYVEGLPIDRYADERRLPVEERLALFLQVCDAVAYAHRNLVVHRDLKPSNILVSADGTVKLLDFGIAKLLGEAAAARPATLTETGGRLLTPEYAAPEQVRGGVVTTATDVYALGVVLYELLSGRRAHRLSTRTPVELERVICEAEPKAPSAAAREAETPGGTRPATPEAVAEARGTTMERLRRRLAGDLDTIVLTALRKEPARRYASVEAFAEDVRRHLAGLPVAARKDTATYRVGKFVRRHRGMVAAGALLLLTLVGGLVATAWQAREAYRQAAKAYRIKTFLQEMLASADPAAKGRAVTVAEVLDAAAQDVHLGLAGEPDVEADLRTTIGRTYFGLGLYEEAAPHLVRALELRRRHYRSGHSAIAESLEDLARLREKEGDHEAAGALYEEALAVWRPGNVRRMVSLNGLGRVRSSRGDYAAAESLFTEALALRRPGTADSDAAVSLTGLGALRRTHHDYAAAESLFAEALTLRRRLYGEAHPRTIESLNNVATVHVDRGAWAEAAALFEEVLARSRTMFGDEHPELVRALGNLAVTYANMQDHAAAERLHREALAIGRKTLGPEHVSVATTLQNLALTRMEQGGWDEADALLHEALSVRRRAFGADHPTVALTLRYLATNAVYRSDYAGAEAALQEALAVYRRRGEAETPEAAAVLAQTGYLALYAKGEPARAEALFRDALDLLGRSPQVDDLLRVSPLIGLGTALVEQGDPEEAEPLLHEALGIARRDLPAESWYLATGESALGACLAAAGRFDEAEPLLLKSHAVLERAGRPAAKELARTRGHLAGLYAASGRPAEAARYRD